MNVATQNHLDPARSPERVKQVMREYFCADMNVERVTLEHSSESNLYRVTLYYLDGRRTRFVRKP